MATTAMPFGDAFQRIHDRLSLGNPLKLVTVKEYVNEMGRDYSEEIVAGCLEYFVQRNYVKYESNDNLSFKITADGIKAWCDWNTLKPPRPPFY